MDVFNIVRSFKQVHSKVINLEYAEEYEMDIFYDAQTACFMCAHTH